MGRKCTPEGIRALGRYMRRSLDDANLLQVDLVERLRALGYDANQNTVSLIVNGSLTSLRLDLICAIADLKIFVDDDKKALTVEDFNAIACEMKEAPKLGVVDIDPEKTPYPEAVQFLLKKKGRLSVEGFAARLRLDPSQLEKILQGKRPTTFELMSMGVLFKDSNPFPLAQAYGMVEDAPLPNGSKSSKPQTSLLDEADD